MEITYNELTYDTHLCDYEFHKKIYKFKVICRV